MNSADSEYLVTCDGYYRRGDALDHISKTNEGLEGVEHEVSDVVVVDRLGDDLDHDLADNQHDYDEIVADHEGSTVEPVPRDAEDMLFLMYTSGTTGQPKGSNTPPAATSRTRPGRATRYWISRPTTPTGARPTSAGSPATPTSSTDRWRSARRA